jgi:hypothetical protein
MTATTDVAQGAELTTYAPSNKDCGAESFLDYGFLDDRDSSFNRAAVEFAARAGGDTNAETAEKTRLLGPASEVRRCLLPARYSSVSARRCFALLRVTNARGAELDLYSLLHDRGVRRWGLPPVSLANEWAVCQQLGAAAARALGGFATTLQQDDALLLDTFAVDTLAVGTGTGTDPGRRLTLNARNAILQRRAEKRVLQRFVDLARATEDFKSMDRSAFESKLRCARACL